MAFRNKNIISILLFVLISGSAFGLNYLNLDLPGYGPALVMGILAAIIYYIFQPSAKQDEKNKTQDPPAARDSKVEEAYLKLAKANMDILAKEDLLRKFQRIVEQSPASIIITNLEGTIEYVNPYFSRVSGYSFEEAIGKNPRILKSGEMPAEGYESLWKTLQTGKTWHGEFHNRHKNGRLYWEYAHIAPVKSDYGTTTHYIAIKEEISKRKAINEARKMYSQALHSIKDIVTILNLQGDFIYANEAFFNTYGYQADEIRGKNISVIIDEAKPKKLLAEILKQTISNGWEGKIASKAKDGRSFKISYRTSVIRTKDGQVSAIIGVSRDLTEEISLQQIKQKAEMLTSVQELAGSVSHEFSQPLQIIYNYISLINMGKLKKEYVSKIEDATRRITTLVDHLGEITHIQKQDYLSSKIIDLKKSSKTGSDASDKKILVVDDEAQILETVSEMLQLSGYACDGAADGLEALQMVSKNTYQLIISDINMPRMNGTELFEKLQSTGFKESFIFMTGYNLSKETNALMKKVDGLLNKPVDMMKLLSIVEKILGKPAANK